MNQNELRNEYLRLVAKYEIPASQEVLDIFSNCLFHLIDNHLKDEVKTDAEKDARLVLQMIFSKVLHTAKLIEGVSFTGPKGQKLNPIIDPTVLAVLIRNMFETVGMFSVVYWHTKDYEDVRKMIYLLWVHAGLSYRQRFEDFLNQPGLPPEVVKELKEKADEEKKQIEQIATLVRGLQTFQDFDAKNQGLIENRLKAKEYLIQVQGKQVKFLSWKDSPSMMGVRPGRLDDIYTYFSLYAHPSNVSVFQFDTMFKKDDPQYLELTKLNLQIFYGLVAMFIADFIECYPQTLASFEQLSSRDQIIVDAYNRLFRGNDRRINSVSELLG